MNRTPPSNIHLRKSAKVLEIQFADTWYSLECELLRVLSPSAEVRGHGKPVLQTGKKNVNITGVEPVGNYAVKLVFDDGHDSGIYDWNYLYSLCTQKEEYWDAYLKEMHVAGASRDPEVSVVQLMMP